MQETISLICRNCGKTFTKTREHAKKTAKHSWNDFCSVKCRDAFKMQRGNNKVKCAFCGKEFLRHKSTHCVLNFCSKECRHKYNTVEVVCDYCGKIFRKNNGEITKANKRKKNDEQLRHFCSNECNLSFHKVLIICNFCGKSFWRQRSWAGRGKNYCSKECYRQDQKDIYQQRRNVKPNRYYGTKWQEIRNQVLERDGYACQICGYDKDSSQLHVHHIIPFRDFVDKDKANDFGNLIVVCRKCHPKIEQKARDGIYQVFRDCIT